MKTMINIKADRAVKEEAQRLAEELGLSLSAVVNASLKHFVRTREIHFRIDPTPTPYLKSIIRQAEKDFRAKKNISKPIRTAKELDRYLDRL